MAQFLDHIDQLIRKEGGYQDHTVSGDRGGRTYAGISYRAHPTWPGWHLLDTHADLGDLKRAVHDLYRQEYWEPLRLDDIHSAEAAEVLFEAAVNMGPRTATKLAQQALMVPIDGHLGPQTIIALNRAEEKLFLALYGLATINRYRMICNRDRSQTKFLLGWINRILGD